MEFLILGEPSRTVETTSLTWTVGGQVWLKLVAMMETSSNLGDGGQSVLVQTIDQGHLSIQHQFQVIVRRAMELHGRACASDGDDELADQRSV